MVSRIALLVGGVGAAAVLAVALALGGFASVLSVSADNSLTGAASSSPDPSASPGAKAEATADPSGAAANDVQTIFVMPSADATRSPDAPDHDRRGGSDGDRDDDRDDYRDDDDRDDDDDDDDRDDDRDDDDDDGRDRGHDDDSDWDED